MTDNMRGALLMIAGMTTFTLNDVCMKALSDEVPLFQALFLRGIGVVIFLYLFGRYRGELSLKMSSSDRNLVIIRSIAEAGSAVLFVTALFNMPIANVSAILQALPLTVTLAAAWFLGEAVGWRRLTAIFVGFIGVLIIVRPGSTGFNIYSIYALLAVVSVTVRDLAARRMSKDVSSMTVAIAAAIAVLVISGGFAVLGEWKSLSPKATLQLGGATFFVLGGYVLSVATMRIGDIAFIAPFRYSSLVVAMILGVMVFGEWPDMMTLLGSVIVVGTGVFTFYRERKAERTKATLPLRMR